jgi:Cu(I)/Ag(I) efflux system membrane protein CusA/SilA
MINKIIKFFLQNRLFTGFVMLLILAWGIIVSPFGWNIGFLPNDPVAVDAIPDIGENQQIVYTRWEGRSPQDVEDQISYPLTTSLLGIPGVKTIRSSSIFGVSSIYILFEEDVEFYWSRARILEKLNSLPRGLLPDQVQPTLGPDATALGQVFWYTLEGRDSLGNPSGGWDAQDLRTVQDYYVKYALNSVKGVSEVASVGGFVKEYQIDLNPGSLKANNVSLGEVIKAVKGSNLDVGAKTMEINKAEYFIRGLGYVKSISDLEETVISVNQNIPVRVKDVGKVVMGPAIRRGILDKEGIEAVGGVVIARYGENPLEVIENIKAKIKDIEPGLSSKKLKDGTISKISIVPFYDRTALIKETLGTLHEALTLEIIITIIVVIVLLLNLRASLIISSMLPMAVLLCFIAMKYVGVDANIVALSGIAIAIGTMVDMSIIMIENILRHIRIGDRNENKEEIIFKGVTQVSGAIITAVLTTVVSFLPVFTLQAAEGKLFGPLAYTKTFALLAAMVLSLFVLPTLAYWIIPLRKNENDYKKRFKMVIAVFYLLTGIVVFFIVKWAAIALIVLGLIRIAEQFREAIKWEILRKAVNHGNIIVAMAVFSYLLGAQWLPLGPQVSLFVNIIFIGIILLLVLGAMYLFIKYYEKILRNLLNYRKTFVAFLLALIAFSFLTWKGFDHIFGSDKNNKISAYLSEAFPGMGEEFMPALDEGSFLLMPTTMPHSGVEENRDVLANLDRAVAAIPEVETVVGKAGRVESALDPAPISMFENVINYKSEYALDEDGNRLRFKVDKEGNYLLKNGEEHNPEEGVVSSDLLVRNRNGEYYRQWRKEIKSPDDIWQNIVASSSFPGLTSAPKLQPIETRLIMMQTGMRAPMGMKIFGPDLKTIEKFSRNVEKVLKKVEGVKSETVFADRMIGKPYIEIIPNRVSMARYGISMKEIQNYIETGVGGVKLTSTVQGRERYGIRVRFARDFRSDPTELENLLIPAKGGLQVPMKQLAKVSYTKGPQMIKSENSFKVGYIVFDKLPERAEVDVVESATDKLNEAVESGELVVPTGVTYKFTGSYENQLRAEKRLSLVIPLALLVIFLILYFQFSSVKLSLMVFSSILVSVCGGFIILWLYGKPWFMNFEFVGANMRDLFQIHTLNLSVAVWVGFIALFGIASDDGVVMATYLKQSFKDKVFDTKEEIRELVVKTGKRRLRPCLMTTSTTLLALLPILSSTGRGADIMIPMAVPVFGGMLIELLTLFVIPILYSSLKEREHSKKTAIA